jgi:5-formyltetrahydrofolate cyclo-ligase
MAGTAPHEKAALRRRVRAARAAVPPAMRAAWSAEICRTLASLPELGCRAVLAYAATPTEVDVDGWLRMHLARGGHVYLPHVQGEHLDLFRVRDLDTDLEPGWRGLREPRAHLRTHPVDPALVDAAVVPGVAFDARGGRLGQGGGHMDRLLARLRPGTPIIGVAFSVQVLTGDAELVPMEDHDVPVEAVVTEQRIHRPC